VVGEAGIGKSFVMAIEKICAQLMACNHRAFLALALTGAVSGACGQMPDMALGIKRSKKLYEKNGEKAQGTGRKAEALSKLQCGSARRAGNVGATFDGMNGFENWKSLQ
jgi:hypothetical protein